MHIKCLCTCIAEKQECETLGIMCNNKLLLALHKIIFNKNYRIYSKLFYIVMIHVDHFHILGTGLKLAIVAHLREYH